MPLSEPTKSQQNGRLPDNALQSIGSGHKLQPAAAEAYRQMVEAAKNDGITWSVTDSYRTFEGQVDVARRKGLYSRGGLAAKPGTSNHGWGLAVDLGGGANIKGTKQNNWLHQNAHRFGFKNIPKEPWHWEYAGAGAVKGEKTTTKMNESYSGSPNNNMGQADFSLSSLFGMFGGMIGGGAGGQIGSLIGGILGNIGGMGMSMGAPMEAMAGGISSAGYPKGYDPMRVTIEGESGYYPVFPDKQSLEQTAPIPTPRPMNAGNLEPPTETPEFRADSGTYTDPRDTAVINNIINQNGSNQNDNAVPDWAESLWNSFNGGNANPFPWWQL
jgi:hypothetical protein